MEQVAMWGQGSLVLISVTAFIVAAFVRLVAYTVAEYLG